jgi:hypothetical protein
MKRFLVILLTLAALCACTPQAYTLLYDMHYPGEAGFVLENKTMSVVYLNDGNRQDSIYVSSLANGLVKGLEKEYFQSDEAIPVFSVPKNRSGVYHAKDSLVSLMVKTDADVLFLFDSPTLRTSQGTVTATSNLYVYDGLDKKRDSVIVVPLTRQYPSRDNIQTAAASYGASIASLFTNDVRREYYSIIYYDTSESWVRALMKAADTDWEGAMEIWMEILSGKASDEQKACAAYNMALGCYMLEDYGLALEWLDRSDKYQPISLNSYLRTKAKALL